MNVYQISLWDRKWKMFMIIAETESQVVSYLDIIYPDRKECYFDRLGNTTEAPHDWTEIKNLGPMPVPYLISEG